MTTALWQGALLVALVVFVFLGGWRPSLVVVLSIPFSVGFAFIAMQWLGISANLMSLGGVAIAIGMMVDGAIVIAENVDRGFRESDPSVDQRDVVARSAAEVIAPLIAAVAVVIVVFLPLFSLQGVEGKTFIADKLRIGQILINLLNNAIKFTKEGKVTVETKSTRYGKGRFRVKLIVTDSGIGISEQQQKLIFSPFVQAENSTQRRYGGTGLGLSIVSQIVKHYGGKIEVCSDLGVGARFIVTLMLDDANAGTVAEKACGHNAVYIPSKQELSAFKALIVEDNEINQLVIKEQLKEIGITADLAENGEEAVEKVKDALKGKSPYTIILMDCHMPVMDGLEATKLIRSMGDKARDIPIIALTANALTGDKEKCLKSGMDDFISKPVGVSRLKECLYRHLSKQLVSNENRLKDPA